MKKAAIARLLILVINLAAIATMAYAGCKSDCRGTYDDDVESCKSLYDDPDDADDLRLCLQTAKDDYDSCIYECNH